MSIQSIFPAGKPETGNMRFTSKQSLSYDVKDSVELSPAVSAACEKPIALMNNSAGQSQSSRLATECDNLMLSDPVRKNNQAGNANILHDAFQSPKSQQSVTVEINKWVVGEDNTSYIIETAGCGAIKIFVDCGKSSYFIVFHSFGTQDSKEAAKQIGNYILNRKEKPESVRILDIQPYMISSDVEKTVNVIQDMLSTEDKTKIDRHTVCLNNINCEKYSQFVRLDMEGTENQILDRCDHLILKSRKMSNDERAMKIKLFQSIPLNSRTSEFLRKWASLSLDEARQFVDELKKNQKKKKTSGSLWNAMRDVLKKIHITT